MHSIQNRLRSLPPLRFDECTRDELRAYFLNTWDLFEMLKNAIAKEEYFYVAPDPLRHPLVFYLGHTAVFYVNKLRLSGAIDKGINDRYEVLFAVGVDPEKSDDLDKGIDWPGIDEVWAYREQVRDLVLDILDQTDMHPNPDQDTPLWALHMGLEHERIHFETSSVLMRQYPTEYLKRPENWNYAPFEAPVPEKRMVGFEGGRVALGKPEDFPTYGWDNEYGNLEVEVAPFEISNVMVTNRDFLDFVESGGYTNDAYWSPEGINWRNKKGLRAPSFWLATDEGFQYRAMFDVIPMPLDWPAEICFFEAAAYCQWVGNGVRIMTEAEWKIASGDAPEDKGDPMFSQCHNLNLHFGSPSPVGYMTSGCSESGVFDIYGNVWEWISNDHYPLPGFKVHPWYEDFSAPFMDSDHSMMLGGAWASAGTSASKYYRLWFRRGFLQHAGFRLARSL